MFKIIAFAQGSSSSGGGNGGNNTPTRRIRGGIPI